MLRIYCIIMRLFKQEDIVASLSELICQYQNRRFLGAFRVTKCDSVLKKFHKQIQKNLNIQFKHHNNQLLIIYHVTGIMW